MADLAITRSAEAQRLAAIGAEAHGGERRDSQPEAEHRERRNAPAPELAVALGAAVTVVYEQGPEGESLIRIVDNARGETIAVVSPEQLRDMTAETGLPPGLLVQVAS
ncbi:MAG: hypothetical protein U0360_02710 [Dehalococcoidia bacterium]